MSRIRKGAGPGNLYFELIPWFLRCPEACSEGSLSCWSEMASLCLADEGQSPNLSTLVVPGSCHLGLLNHRTHCLWGVTLLFLVLLWPSRLTLKHYGFFIAQTQKETISLCWWGCLLLVSASSHSPLNTCHLLRAWHHISGATNCLSRSLQRPLWRRTHWCFNIGCIYNKALLCFSYVN